MKKALFIFLSFLLLSFIISSCSKQVKIENILTNGTGRWDLDEIKHTIAWDTFPPIRDTLYNQGEVDFYESGTGTWIQIDTALAMDTDYLVVHYFSWENTENELLIDFEGPSLEIPFTLVESDEDHQLLKYERSIDSLDYRWTFTYEIMLKKLNEIANE